MSDLQLSGGDDPRARAAWQRQQDVLRENRAAATTAPLLDPTDPRWVLAVRARSQLQGTVMTPERRQRVMTTARQLGVRPFEASVIIALVQDQARRGGSAESTAGMLALLEAPDRRSAHHWLRLIAALACAATATALIAWWLVGAR